MSDWPDLPRGWDGDPETLRKYRELILGAKVDLAKAAVSKVTTPPPSPADDQAEITLHANLATVVTGSIERARDGAKFVETAAAAVATVYTGILGFLFAAATRPIPPRGVYAAILLGLAIVGVSFYLAFFRPIPGIGRVIYSTSRPEDLWRRTEYLAKWTTVIVAKRAWALRAAVVSLAFGVAFMPLAFLPDTLPSNPFATDWTSSNQAVQTSPQIAWPTPPVDVSDPNVAAVLYKAQLDQFVKTLTPPATASSPQSGTDTNRLSFILFVISLGVIALVGSSEWLGAAVKRFRRWRQQPPSPPGAVGSVG